MSRGKALGSAIVAAVAALLPALARAAQGVDAYFKDKSIRIMVGHSPGGSFDFYARLASDMLRKHLPGAGNVVVENKPGGGGLVATAFFYANGARDGTMLAVFPEGISA